jgi:hypothetical protein
MRTSFAVGFAMATLLLSAELLPAEVLTHAGAKVQINVPEKWTQKQDGDVLVITSPDGGVGLVFAVVAEEDAEAVFEAMDKQLEQQTGTIAWENDGEASELTINGMPAAEWNGSAKGGAMFVDVLVIDTPADKDLGVYWFTDAASEKKNQAAIETIVKGLKPVK